MLPLAQEEEKKGKKGMMAIKLYMEKAYDRLEWDFIQEALKATSFPPKITKLIMACISTVTYQFLVNGKPSRSFKHRRGIRQGDPISPYIFILCANILSGLLHNESSANLIHGLLVARNAPKITHIFFADDNILCPRANLKADGSILQTLQRYQQASGQLVSLEKYEVSYSRNMP